MIYRRFASVTLKSRNSGTLELSGHLSNSLHALFGSPQKRIHVILHLVFVRPIRPTYGHCAGTSRTAQRLSEREEQLCLPLWTSIISGFRLHHISCDVVKAILLPHVNRSLRLPLH